MPDGQATVSGISVDLARQPDFWLGALHVRPSVCQVIFDDGPIDLQPKIMQVLVALSQAQGQSVSREDLRAICWGNVVVGDDSVHRCVARLRRLSLDEAPGIFSIVTQARVGYRLILNDHGAAGPKVDAPLSTSTTGSSAPVPSVLGRTLVICVAAMVILGSITSLLFFAQPAPLVYRIAVRDFREDGMRPGIGESLADRVAAAVSERDLPIVSRARSRRGDLDGARFIVGGEIQSVADQTKVNIHLDDVSSGLTLWADTITRSSSEADALQDQVASKVADLMDLTRRWLGPRGGSAKPEAVAALLRAAGSVRGRSNTILQTREAFRRFRDLDPQSSRAHSGYAMATLLGARGQTREIAAQWRTEAASEARRAIALDPRNGEGYMALGVLPSKDLAAREAWFLKGLAVDPDNESLPNYLGELLVQVGRVGEGVIWIDRGVKLDPLSSPKAESLIDALSVAGHFDDAGTLIERSKRLWPDDVGLRRTILFRSLIYAAPSRALVALDQFQSADKPLPGNRAQIWRDFERARSGALPFAAARSHLMKDPSAANTALSSLDTDEISATVAALASLGDRDDAFRTIDMILSTSRHLDRSVLFEPATQSLRNDPRFSHVASDLGLVSYWSHARRKPDFCSGRPTATVCS